MGIERIFFFLECLFLFDRRKIAASGCDNFTLTACEVSNAASRGGSRLAGGYSLGSVGIDYGIPRFLFAIENTFISILSYFDINTFY